MSQAVNHKDFKADVVQNFEEICSATWKDIYQYIYYKVQNREEAEDITQETYMKAFSFMKRENIEIKNYTAFLKSVSVNLMKDRWRKKKHPKTSINIEDIEQFALSSEDFTSETENRAVMEEALTKLSDEKRRVIILRILEGYTVADTARIMKKKEGTVRVLQYRALKELCDVLKELKFEI